MTRAFRNIAIFTLTKDRLEYTQRTIESLYSTVDSDRTDHYFIDNGSSDDTKDWLRHLTSEHPSWSVFANRRNVGISRASNQALTMIKAHERQTGYLYDFVIKVDNDCEFPDKSWLEALLAVQAVRPSILSPFVDGLRDHIGGAPRERYEMLAGHRVGWAHFLGGICVMAPAEAWRTFLFDEDRAYIWGAMSQFCNACRFRWPCGYVEDVRVVHMDTTAGQERKYPGYFELRKAELVTKPESPLD